MELETPLVRAEVGSQLRVGIRAGDLLLATESPHGLSARNILPGTIRRLEQRDVIVSAIVDCGGTEFEVHLTLAARDALQLDRRKECLGRGQNAFLPFDGNAIANVLEASAMPAWTGHSPVISAVERSSLHRNHRDPLPVHFLAKDESSAQALGDFLGQQIAMIAKESFLERCQASQFSSSGCGG